MFARPFALMALPALLLCVPTLALAKDLALQIDYDSTATGADGVTRITRYSDRLIRRDNDSWLARVLPAHAHSEADHRKADKGHKHMDIGAAARWVTRANDGKLQVRLVNTHEKVLIDIPKVEYSNIGFDGDWSSASQLLATEQVRQMQPVERPAPAGSRWYETRRGDLTVRVLWDERQAFPRRIESLSSNGLYRSTVSATPLAMPANLPWNQIQGYARKEYSDLLD